MADVEQRAEAEAAKKGLSGGARKSYIGGVFNRIRQAHARATTPGKHARKMFNRRERVQARLDARLAMQPHREAIDVLRRQRNERIAAHQDEPKSAPQAATPAKPPKLPAPERQRQRAIADAIKHGAPDFPPGTLAAAQGKTQPKREDQPVLSVMEAANMPLTPRPEATGTSYFRDPTAPVDPYFLKRLYGDAQLRVALSRYTEPRLAEAVRAVQARHAGTKPAGRSRAEMIAYIEQHVKDTPHFPPGTLAAAQGKSKTHLSVRPYNYHGNPGYLISGHDAIGRSISIFARSKSEAERMRDDIKAGRETQFDSER